jgi:hypothetical protein
VGSHAGGLREEVRHGRKIWLATTILEADWREELWVAGGLRNCLNRCRPKQHHGDRRQYLTAVCHIRTDSGASTINPLFAEILLDLLLPVP